MNILGDFIGRVNALYPVDMDDEELNSLLTTIKNQENELVQLTDEVKKLQAELKKAEANAEPAPKKTAARKTASSAAKKTAAKKDAK